MPEDFEAQLRHVLKREDPPAGFAERVIARAEAEAAAKVQPIRHAEKPVRKLEWKPWIMAVAAVLLVTAPVAYQFDQQRQHQREEQQQIEMQRAEQARVETMVALRITAEKLNLMRDKVLQMETAAKGAGE